ncbi:hypothetical protein RHO15_05965 [Utexia brackfieldae]
MSHSIYLSTKAADKPALIFIRTNCHNQQGWIEKPNGKAIKLQKARGKHA